jgi:hypothetical protein
VAGSNACGDVSVAQARWAGKLNSSRVERGVNERIDSTLSNASEVSQSVKTSRYCIAFPYSHAVLQVSYSLLHVSVTDDAAWYEIHISKPKAAVLFHESPSERR